MNWRRPVPLWLFLVGILATASVTTAVILFPSVLGPRRDFSLSLNQTPMLIQAPDLQGDGGSGATLVTIKSVRSFTGIVTLSTSSSAGITTKFQDSQTGETRNQIVLGEAGNLTLVVDDKLVGNFTVILTASSGTISHTTTIPVIVQNLTITSSPASLTIARGSSGTADVGLTSNNGLTGNLTLGAYTYVVGNFGQLHPDSASSASVAPSSLTLAPGSSSNAILTVSVGQSEGNSQLIVSFYAQTTKQAWTFNLQVTVNVV